LQVCCTLQPVLRFAPFPTFGIIAPAHRCAVRPIPLVFPGSAVFLHTLQSVPLVVRRTASPRPLPSRRSYRPQGFSRPTSPLSRPRVATRPDPLLSWASFPFRALPVRSACRRNARPGPARTRTRPSLVRPCLADLARSSPWHWPEFCSDRHRRSDLPWAFLLHPTTRERVGGHASRPFEDHTETNGGVIPVFWVSKCRWSPLLRQTFDAGSPGEQRGRRARNTKVLRWTLATLFSAHRSESAHIRRFPGGCGESSMNRIADPHGVLYVKDQPWG
jgi:hypothetical protein